MGWGPLSGRRLGKGRGRAEWLLAERLGGGSFGQVYRATDEDGRESAVKLELQRPGEPGLLCQEVRVLRAFRWSWHAPELLAAGREGTVLHWVAMERLGRSLAEMRRSLGRPFSLPSGLRVLSQGVRALEDLHQSGFLHRDMKPGNLAMGMGERSHTLVLIDFGLARRWRRADGTGRARRARTSAPFRGSLRYASAKAHMGRELGRVDDLWSLLYLVLELVGLRLPWASVASSRDNLQLIGSLKAGCTERELLGHLAGELGPFRRQLLSSEPDGQEGPPYAQLRSVPLHLLRTLPPSEVASPQPARPPPVRSLPLRARPSLTATPRPPNTVSLPNISNTTIIDK